MVRHNVGGIDRVLRVTLGLVLFLAGLFLLTGKSALGVTLAVVGLLALLTGLVRFCALYLPFGISTAGSGEPQMKPMCDCDAWMRETQGRHIDTGSPGSSQAQAPRQ